jgi:glycosyltransferase involved in cell wall biosynthesis
MVIDAPVAMGKRSVFLPSKLIEYVAVGRPIIGLTPDGTAADLIRRLGGWVADPGDAHELGVVMRQFLSYVLEHHKEGTVWGNSDVRSEFEVGNVAASFRKILLDLA